MYGIICESYFLLTSCMYRWSAAGVDLWAGAEGLAGSGDEPGHEEGHQQQQQSPYQVRVGHFLILHQLISCKKVLYRVVKTAEYVIVQKWGDFRQPMQHFLLNKNHVVAAKSWNNRPDLLGAAC